MSNVAKLKKKAAELEERRHYEKALTIYEQVLEEMVSSDEDVDVSLFNRVGDLALRQGRVAEAVSHYERAVDLYADGGFFNNAIALCNKILRNAPGRTSIYYKLGKISARKGFTSDAKLNFLEFADRMQKAGQTEEAFSALEEFANLCPDQDDVRLMLAEQLTRLGRKREAIAQLQVLFSMYTAEGRTTEANATLERMRALDPEIVPEVAPQAEPEKNGDLVFLDISYDEPTPGAGGRRVSPSRAAIPLRRTPPDEVSTKEGTEGTEGKERPSGAVRSDSRVSDPRASGSLRIIHPGDDIAARLDPDNILNAARDPGYFDPSLRDPDAPHATGTHTGTTDAPQDRAEQPLHDLAHAGILPQLNTPGLVAATGNDGQHADIELIDTEDAVNRIEFDSILDSLGDDIEPAILDEPPAPVELLNIQRTEGEVLDLVSRTTDSDLRIVHGTTSGAQGGADADPGEEGVGDNSADPGSAPTMNLISPLSRSSLKSIAWSAPELRDLLRDEPGDLVLRRRLGEVLIEDGSRAEGLSELDSVMIGHEGSGAISEALSVADEIVRIEPNSVRHHQKRVEYCFRTDDQTLLVDAYLELADALFRTAQLAKATVVYQRVVELSPDNSRARFALGALVKAPESGVAQGGGGAEAAAGTGASGAGALSSPPGQPPDAAEAAAAEDMRSFVNLGDLLREDEEPRSTRMVVEEETPSGDEEADFAEMLERFKRGLNENVDDEDYESHYDLGVAFREMGLLDEAIAQFQRALRGTTRRIRTLEALGQCFVERSQFQVAVNVLLRAVAEGDGSDENLVGVLYLLAYAYEAMQKYDEALKYYQRVFMVDIQFRDVTTRIAALEKAIT
jgi:tetratricopeptide (TPR) repeat protein